MNYQEAQEITEEKAREYFEELRWPNGKVLCVFCYSDENTLLDNSASADRPKREGLYKCKKCQKQFTVTINTIMESSHVSPKVWLMLFWLIESGVSINAASKLTEITYKSAYEIKTKIDEAKKSSGIKHSDRVLVYPLKKYVGIKRNKKEEIADDSQQLETGLKIQPINSEEKTENSHDTDTFNGFKIKKKSTTKRGAFIKNPIDFIGEPETKKPKNIINKSEDIEKEYQKYMDGTYELGKPIESMTFEEIKKELLELRILQNKIHEYFELTVT